MERRRQGGSRAVGGRCDTHPVTDLPGGSEMRPMTRLAVFGLAAAALLGGGQSARADLTFNLNSTVLTGVLPGNSYLGSYLTISVSKEATANFSGGSTFRVDFTVNAPNSGATAGIYVSNIGVQLKTAVASQLVS